MKLLISWDFHHNHNQFSQNGVKNRKHPGSSRSAGHVLCSEMQLREAEQLKTMSDSIPVRLLWTQSSQNYTPRHGETSSLIFLNKKYIIKSLYTAV